jgi:hypothetical protein
MAFTFEKPAVEFEQTRELIRSVSEFLECVKWKWKEWGNAVRWKPQEGCPWLRGVGSEYYKPASGRLSGQRCNRMGVQGRSSCRYASRVLTTCQAILEGSHLVF